MGPIERISSTGARALAILIAVLGIAIVVRTIAAGGGPLSLGVIIGLLFLAVGAGRLYLGLRANS